MTYPTERWGKLLTGIALLLAFADPAICDETRLDRIDHELTTIGQFTGNARAKLANGVVGRPSVTDAPSRQGPVQICCSTNVERIDESISVVRRIVGELEACYLESANEGAIAMSSLFGADLASFSRAVEGFAESSSPQGAMSRLGAMTRLYIVMKDSIESVEDCPVATSEASPDADTDESDRKKRKKKKKQPEPDDPDSR